MPGRFNVTTTLSRIWDAPDSFRLMDPLPSIHRKGIIVAALVIVTGFLWPNSRPTSQHAREPALSTANQRQMMQAELVTPPRVASRSDTVRHPPLPFQNNDIEQQWRGYRIGSGKTLAQLFRDHNLPAQDVYAMAKVEGEDKPLSNLQSGEMVQVRQNANGVVTGLTIESGSETQVLFTRQPDGSFLRVH